MKKNRNIFKVYDEIKELIAMLKVNNHAKEASVLEHRMYEVSWTTGSELLVELLEVINNYLKYSKEKKMDGQVIEKMKSIVVIIESFFRNLEKFNKMNTPGEDKCHEK